MKIKNNYKIRAVAGENIVIPLGKESKRNEGIFRVNGSGAELFKLYQNDADIQAGMDLLVNNYGLDAEQAKQDVTDFIEMLKSYDMIEQ